MFEHETHRLLKELIEEVRRERESQHADSKEIIRLLRELVPKPKAVSATLKLKANP